MDNGLAAVEVASQEPFDIILMDLQMPGMDGFEATAAMRELPELDRTPIVALTAHTMVGDRERCLAAGMEEYLSKPLNLAELVEVVEATARAVLPASVGAACGAIDPLAHRSLILP